MKFCIECSKLSGKSICSEKCLEERNSKFKISFNNVDMTEHGVLPSVENRNTRIKLKCGSEFFIAELFENDDHGVLLNDLKDITKNFENVVSGLKLNIDGKVYNAALFREIPDRCPIDKGHPAKIIEACTQLFKVLSKINAKGYTYHGLTPNDIYITENGAYLGSLNFITKSGCKISSNFGSQYYSIEKKTHGIAESSNDVFSLALSLVEILNESTSIPNHGKNVNSVDLLCKYQSICDT